MAKVHSLNDRLEQAIKERDALGAALRSELEKSQATIVELKRDISDSCVSRTRVLILIKTSEDFSYLFLYYSFSNYVDESGSPSSSYNHLHLITRHDTL